MNNYYLRFFGKGSYGEELNIEAEELTKSDLEHILKTFEGEFDQGFLYKYKVLDPRAPYGIGQGEWNLQAVFHDDKRKVPKHYGDKW